MACAVDEQSGWNLITAGGDFRSGVNIRCAEFHEMKPGGSIPELRHFDVGSLLTIDILLCHTSKDKKDRGGIFQTVEKNDLLQDHKFDVGDALVFVSHKYHRVSKLLRGLRRVLVIELWKGPERNCGHRCDESPLEDCTFRDSTEL